eukprot:TRINITY_DN13139_c0_g2_i1.p1 TRINITY_DN13139_c0_g2~~TRINITY_DN13139_c0_g2_i1.p1  ORF type:complete len:610 (+),score=86.05 TRINITY_DN13139_c0_g2_i1:102-1832(+)
MGTNGSERRIRSGKRRSVSRSASIRCSKGREKKKANVSRQEAPGVLDFAVEAVSAAVEARRRQRVTEKTATSSATKRREGSTSAATKKAPKKAGGRKSSSNSSDDDSDSDSSTSSSSSSDSSNSSSSSGAGKSRHKKHRKQFGYQGKHASSSKTSSKKEDRPKRKSQSSQVMLMQQQQWAIYAAHVQQQQYAAYAAFSQHQHQLMLQQLATQKKAATGGESKRSGSQRSRSRSRSEKRRDTPFARIGPRAKVDTKLNSVGRARNAAKLGNKPTGAASDGSNKIVLDVTSDDTVSQPLPVGEVTRKAALRGLQFLGKAVERPTAGIRQKEAPPKLAGDCWEESKEKVGLALFGERPSSSSSWTYVLKDEARRSYVGYLPGGLELDACAAFFERARDGTNWSQPQGALGPIPRKTAWMVASGCSCAYRYGGIEVQPQEFPPWMLDLMKVVMPRCGLQAPAEMPNSCNMNLYEDGSMSVGWHSDDERLFQGKFRDCGIISLSLGTRRKFELRLNWPAEGERSSYMLMLGNGDLCTMEGMTQKHMQHRVAREANVNAPRINLTWRWIAKHDPRCPCARCR